MKEATTLIALALAGPLAQAQDAAALQRCKALAEPLARLACYDSAVPAAAVIAPPITQPAAQFGLEDRSAKSELSLIESQIIGEFDGWEARSIFRLANGQIWQVTDDSNAAYSLRDPKVTIRRGMFGAFYLEIEGAKRAPRVKRLQ